ncbi:MAG: hypothetical protein A4E53_02584 [Pelotomaculum sp. PtaB.Bin104]|nr:MAG: hypothetical protein A4E53_02584 [Pelotomaculum sp. PtaB.Bin104]
MAWSEIKDKLKENHAWNEVLIEGRWVTMDTTWDAGGVNQNNNFVFRFSRKYYDPRPEDFAKDHIKLEERYY